MFQFTNDFSREQAICIYILLGTVDRLGCGQIMSIFKYSKILPFWNGLSSRCTQQLNGLIKGSQVLRWMYLTSLVLLKTRKSVYMEEGLNFLHQEYSSAGENSAKLVFNICTWFILVIDILKRCYLTQCLENIALSGIPFIKASLPGVMKYLLIHMCILESVFRIKGGNPKVIPKCLGCSITHLAVIINYLT